MRLSCFLYIIIMCISHQQIRPYFLFIVSYSNILFEFCRDSLKKPKTTTLPEGTRSTKLNTTLSTEHHRETQSYTLTSHEVQKAATQHDGPKAETLHKTPKAKTLHKTSKITAQPERLRSTTLSEEQLKIQSNSLMQSIKEYATSLSNETTILFANVTRILRNPENNSNGSRHKAALFK